MEEANVFVPAKKNTISSKNACEASWGCDIVTTAFCNVKSAQACINIAAWAAKDLLPMQAANIIQRSGTDLGEPLQPIAPLSEKSNHAVDNTTSIIESLNQNIIVDKNMEVQSQVHQTNVQPQDVKIGNRLYY